MKNSAQAVRSEDLTFVQAVAETVFEAYDGKGIKWVHPDGSNVWKINSGQRAGVVGVESNGRRCCAKLFYDRRIQACVRNALGFSKAKRAFNNACRLKTLGVGCPEMIGLARLGIFGPFILVAELCDDAVRVDHYIHRKEISTEGVINFASFVRWMHERGVSHIDFSLRNILMRSRAGQMEFLLLDYEDVRFSRNISRRTRIGNLHHMNERALKIIPLKWRLFFLREYLQGESVREWVDELNGMILRHPSKYTD